MTEKNLFERAFELCREGRCRTLDEVKRKLAAEGYSAVDSHLSGFTIKKQLRALMSDKAKSAALIGNKG